MTDAETTSNLETILNGLLRICSNGFEDTALQLALIHLRSTESNVYSARAELIFFWIVEKEMGRSPENFSRLMGARISYRSTVGCNPMSPNHGKLTDAELRRAAYSAMKHSRIGLSAEPTTTATPA